MAKYKLTQDLTILDKTVLTRDSEPGVYPSILQDLFAKRKVIKKEMEHYSELSDKCTDPEQKAELDF